MLDVIIKYELIYKYYYYKFWRDKRLNYRKYRVGIIFFVIMLIIQLILPNMLSFIERNSKYASILDNNFRFGERVDKVVLDTFIKHIKKESGYRIVFIGDSVVAGATVKNNADTIPVYFKNIAEKMYPENGIKVFNLAAPGNRPSDIYFTLKKIYDNNAADLVIMNVNYAFYSDEMLKSVPVARPELFETELQPDTAKVLGLKYSSLESTSKNIASYWNVYGMREELSFYLFGKNPREKIYDFTKNLTEGLSRKTIEKSDVEATDSLDKPWWSSKPFPKDKITHWVQVFNIDDFNDNNKGFWFLKKTTSDMKSSNIKTIAFLTPMNSNMIEENKLMRYGLKFQSNMGKIQNEFKKNGLTIFDYTTVINSDKFNDLFHLLSTGNKELAEILMNDTKDIIKRGIGQ